MPALDCCREGLAIQDEKVSVVGDKSSSLAMSMVELVGREATQGLPPRWRGSRIPSY